MCLKARPMAFSNWSLKCLTFNSLTLYISEPSKMSCFIWKSAKTSEKEKFLPWSKLTHIHDGYNWDIAISEKCLSEDKWLISGQSFLFRITLCAEGILARGVFTDTPQRVWWLVCRLALKTSTRKKKRAEPLTRGRLLKRIVVFGLGYSHGNLCREERKCGWGEGIRFDHGGRA